MGKEAERNLGVAAQTASMAAAGATLGPVGAAAGAVVGFTLGMFGKKAEKDAEKEARQLAKKQAERERKAVKAAQIAQRRQDAQAKEDRDRAFKDQSGPRGPVVLSEDQLLASSMSAGPGTPYDQYMGATYGRPFAV
tara:strand:+ start:4118 stop:4528 length:411 start_codon:yes stop_codon:yes gene_type:complete